MIVAHGQILSLNEHIAKVTRKVSLLEIGFVVRAGREHDDARLVGLTRRKLRERILRGEKKSGDAVNMIVAKCFRQNARGDETIRQRVTRAGRNLRAVRDHKPASVGRARHIGGVKM